MTTQNTTHREAFTLLKRWADALLPLQVAEMENPALRGAVLCPACGCIHGRCADAAYPLAYLAEQTGDERYVNAARRMVDWAEENMRMPDGSYRNDHGSPWRGITVFAAIGLGLALLHHGNVLGEETKSAWTDIFFRQARFLDGHLQGFDTNINYFVSGPAAFALAFRLSGEDVWREKAARWEAFARRYIAPDGLLFGEGKPNDQRTPKGCLPVDIGYNVEESLPNLLLYAQLAGDEACLSYYADIMKIHLHFMLPDGGWDNSFGTRHAKWTYWGSRTSDGCQAGLAPLLTRDPVFAEAALRNLRLYAACTGEGGLLHGGPMYEEAGEPPCVHHTFCHMKALAHYCRALEGLPELERTTLPREAAQGVMSFPTAHVHLLSKGDFRMTLTNHDFVYTPSSLATGGMPTMLFHKKAGPLCAATMAEYTLVEPHNMQLSRRFEDMACLTPRLEIEKDGVSYCSSNDIAAGLSVEDRGDTLWALAQGRLATQAQEKLSAYQVEYTLAAEGLSLRLWCEGNAVFHLPLIAGYGEGWTLSEDMQTAAFPGYGIALTTDAAFQTLPMPTGRRFHFVGGFLAIPFTLAVPAGRNVQVAVREVPGVE